MSVLECISQEFIFQEEISEPVSDTMAYCRLFIFLNAAHRIRKQKAKRALYYRSENYPKVNSETWNENLLSS